MIDIFGNILGKFIDYIFLKDKGITSFDSYEKKEWYGVYKSLLSLIFIPILLLILQPALISIINLVPGGNHVIAGGYIMGGMSYIMPINLIIGTFLSIFFIRENFKQIKAYKFKDGIDEKKYKIARILNYSIMFLIIIPINILATYIIGFASGAFIYFNYQDLKLLIVLLFLYGIYFFLHIGIVNGSLSGVNRIREYHKIVIKTENETYTYTSEKININDEVVVIETACTRQIIPKDRIENYYIEYK